ncbi:MAG TPA: hypothetical protein EYG87_00460 [Methanothermococcus okinawensis]|uniref:Uncharacterized protein n=1 Tax=Methanofervidicoccus abyssi TaxID=2082189 RepID=A0A401HNN4_9EURY|nr:hypothetical protein [Methanofervidicoccus abyssi]GBF35864.1 hypothetical protein MHHB_P0089 [Methanofervidicoccus abyssi]HIP16176.1 hypothetical protein [Methanothermococcus okinawensis]HIP34504.1 hypothetical protein [Methanothermococcus okinawensis]
MDVYEVLFQKCLEHMVIVDGKKIPLWAISKEDIEEEKVCFDLEWESLQDLVIFLYELKIEQRNSKELIKFPIEKILIGIAFLKSKKSGYSNTDDTSNICINYLSDIITARINCISKYYYLIKKPLNTNIFDEVILKFPQKKDIRTNNIEDIKEIVFKLKNLQFDI